MTTQPKPTTERVPRGCEYQPGIVAIVDCVIAREGQSGNVNIWHCIIQRESGWNPNATGRAGERGLTQLHPVHWNYGRWPYGWLREWWRLWEPAWNIERAIELYHRAGGFGPWTTGGSCI